MSLVTHMLNHPTKLPLVDDDPSMVRLLTKIIERQFEDEIELASLTDPKGTKTDRGTSSRYPRYRSGNARRRRVAGIPRGER